MLAAARSASAVAARRPFVGAVRPFSALARLHEATQSELSHERENKDSSDLATKFADLGFKYSAAAHTILSTATKENDDFLVRLEWQLGQMDPESGEAAADGAEEENLKLSTDFTVVLKNKKADGAGLAYYCYTVPDDENSRFYVSNVQFIKKDSDMDDKHSYSGPEFEELDMAVQSALDDVITDIGGVNDDVAELIDQAASSVEQAKYVEWLEAVKAFSK